MDQKRYEHGDGKQDKILGIRDGEGPEQYNGRTGGGESGGGAYPNPHSGKKPENDGFMGHGGQTEQPYYGSDQLGDRNLGSGENVNSATKSTGKKKSSPTD
jgi:hypothetical protein